MPKSIKTGASPSKPRSKKTSPRKQSAQDPFASREAENYENPIPSREFILEHLEEAGEPLGHTELCERLKLVSDEQIEAPRGGAQGAGRGWGCMGVVVVARHHEKVGACG